MRPLRGATIAEVNNPGDFPISIHAPLAGRDSEQNIMTTLWANFNPRAPCGARPVEERVNALEAEFQSTRPLRGATWGRDLSVYDVRDFNPRAPCGARRRTEL